MEIIISILNYATHAHSSICWYDVKQWISASHYPIIVTVTSDTLIDNVFATHLEDICRSVQGLFITFVSDDFPIFHVSRWMQLSDADAYKCKRLYSLRNKGEFVMLLAPQNGLKLTELDTEHAFDIFHNRLTEVYIKHLPNVRMKWYNNRKL